MPWLQIQYIGELGANGPAAERQRLSGRPQTHLARAFKDARTGECAFKTTGMEFASDINAARAKL